MHNNKITIVLNVAKIAGTTRHQHTTRAREELELSDLKTRRQNVRIAKHSLDLSVSDTDKMTKSQESESAATQQVISTQGKWQWFPNCG